MAVTKTDWSKPASDPVNRGQSAAAARYQAMADYYTPNGGAGTVYAGGSPVLSVGGDSGGDGSAAAAAVQAMIDEQIARKQAEEAQRQAMLVGTPAMGFTDQMMAGGLSPGLLQARYGVNAPAVSQYLGKTIPGGLGQAALGMLGFKTAQQHLATGTGQPVLDASGQVRGTLSTGPFGSVVYSGARIPGYEGEYAELIAPPPAPPLGEGGSEVVGTVTDPMTGQEKCPEGYIFDEDLQACRLDTSAPVATPLEPRAPIRTYSLLDQAPTGLLEFQRRYGLPQQQMDFSLLT